MKVNKHKYTLSGWQERGIALTDTFASPITVDWMVKQGVTQRTYKSLEDIPVDTTLQLKPARVEVEGERHMLFPVVVGKTAMARKMLKLIHKEEQPEGDGVTLDCLSRAKEYSDLLEGAKHEVVWMISEKPVKDYSKRHNPKPDISKLTPAQLEVCKRVAKELAQEIIKESL